MRSPLAPELPTLTETGLPGFDTYTRWGFMAPAGTPAQIIAKWNTEVARILGTPEMKAFLAPEGAQPAPTTAEAFAAPIKREIPKCVRSSRTPGPRWSESTAAGSLGEWRRL
jgi:tripartite-type tricarboxylate transporter receptor subunit TctC